MQAHATYPVHYLADYRERQSRLSALFHWVLVIPHAIALTLYGYLAALLAFFAWFAILVTGRYPDSLFGLVEGYVRYGARVHSYTWLLHDRFPPFGPGSDGDGYPVHARVEQAARLSRLTTFFRSLLVIPAVIVLAVLELVLLVAGVAAWLVVVVTGRLPRGLFDALVLPLRYLTRRRLPAAPHRSLPLVRAGGPGRLSRPRPGA